MSTTTSRTSSRAFGTAAALLLAATVLSVFAPSAQATGSEALAAPAPQVAHVPINPVRTGPTAAQTRKRTQIAFGKRIVSIVSSRRGSPYVYGADGPRRFDCSGLTEWTFRQVGRQLPHSAAAQYGRVRHIRASDRRPGDLVFFSNGGGIYHVAVYAGRNEIWHAPYPGTSVRKERLWTGAVFYGRIG